jgi:hypothetical protein
MWAVFLLQGLQQSTTNVTMLCAVCLCCAYACTVLCRAMLVLQVPPPSAAAQQQQQQRTAACPPPPPAALRARW